MMSEALQITSYIISLSLRVLSEQSFILRTQGSEEIIGKQEGWKTKGWRKSHNKELHNFVLLTKYD
jgi:hypothetical protein